MAMFAPLVTTDPNTGKTVSQLVAELPRYENVKTKFECRREDANRRRA